MLLAGTSRTEIITPGARGTDDGELVRIELFCEVGPQLGLDDLKAELEKVGLVFHFKSLLEVILDQEEAHLAYLMLSELSGTLAGLNLKFLNTKA